MLKNKFSKDENWRHGFENDETCVHCSPSLVLLSTDSRLERTELHAELSSELAKRAWTSQLRSVLIALSSNRAIAEFKRHLQSKEI